MRRIALIAQDRLTARRVRALLVYTATLTRLEPEAAVLDALLAQLGAKGMDAA